MGGRVMIKKIMDFARNCLSNTFEDYFYMRRLKIKPIDGVSFEAEHRCYTGYVGIAEAKGESIPLMRALREQGIATSFIANDFIDINDLSPEEYASYSSDEMYVLNEKAQVFEIVSAWVFSFKSNAEIKLISQ